MTTCGSSRRGGRQIRSVLQPCQLVKELRTGVASTSPQDVLDAVDTLRQGGFHEAVEVAVEPVEQEEERL
jgi:hypothetical protein